MKNRDSIVFLGLFFGSILFMYFMPLFFSYLWFWLILALFIKAKQNYIWVIFFWLIFTSPGYLFFQRGTFHLPSISVPGLGREIFYNEIVSFVIIIKAIVLPVRRQHSFYYKNILYLIIYSVFLLVLGFLLGSNLLTVLKSIRYFVPILLLMAIPKIIPYDSVIKMVKLMFISVFILVSVQFFDFIVGAPFASILGENKIMFSGNQVDAHSKVFDVTAGAVRTIYGPFILLISLILSVVQMSLNSDNFKKWYLSLIIFLTSFSVFMSATRGWIIGVVMILLSFIYLSKRKFGGLLVTSLLFLLIVFSIPQLNQQIVNAFERVLTLESIAQGDMSAGGTLSRITERSPRVMNKFYESPIFGFGFSNDFYEYLDGHVGNQSLLLNGGVLGFALYFSVIISFLLNYYSKSKKTKVALVFLFGLLAMVAIHSSTAMIFGFSLQVGTAISLGLFFFFSDFFLFQNKNHVCR